MEDQSSPASMMLKQDKKTRSGNACLSFACWFFQLATWGLIGFLIVTLFGKGELQVPGILFGISYVTYIILEFCSPTCSYLMNKQVDQGMYEKMGRLFATPPVINFYAECYHYETHTYTTTNNEGKTETHTETRKVVTHTDSYNMPYYSSKDVSGLFLLRMDIAQAKQKAFIKLHLQKEINFADAISYSDYLTQKDLFWRRNRFYDVYMDFSETRYIPGMDKHNLVKIGNEDPCSVKIGWYILAVLFTFGQFYKWWVDSYCVFQNFKIRKLVSTRYNLLAPQFVNQYQQLNPTLNLVVETFEYKPQDTGYCSVDVQPVLPTQEELERAKQYENQVPNYGLTSNGGVIQDIPEFNEQNYNTPPPAFSSMGNNTVLEDSQINKNQNVNMTPNYLTGNYNAASNYPNYMPPNQSMGGEGSFNHPQGTGNTIGQQNNNNTMGGGGGGGF